MDYSLLKDLRLEFSDEEAKGFSLSFWIYLPKPTHYPAILISQVHPNMRGVVPFLVLNLREEIELRQFLFSRKETLDPASSTPQKRFTSTSTKFPLDKWVHVGCEISANMAQLYINGEIKEDLIFFSGLTNLYNPNELKRAAMIGTDKKAVGVPGYVHNAKLLPLKFSMKELYVENPPLQLSIDMPSAYNLFACSPGVGIIVDDKPPKNYFSLYVILLNALGQPVDMDNIEVNASFMYYINEPVESSDDAKAPVTSKMSNGCAYFRFKIPKSSSKLRSRSFRIKFDILNISSYPFFTTISLPIWSVSGKRHLASATPLLDASQTSGLEDVSSDVQHVCERTNSEVETMELWLKSMSLSKALTYNSIAIKYGLDNTNERALLLNDFAPAVSDQDLAEFANQVSFLSECIHDRKQILIAKKLIENGAKLWKRISGDDDYAVWNHALFFIHGAFTNIASSHFRSLSRKDNEILKRVAGCDGQYFMSRENFKRLWYWLYPVAVTLSSGRVNAIWGSTSPKLIEGFVTKEEAEFSLRSSDKQVPGTFILRFPTTTSWPHQDAGSLFVTYIGSDNSTRHKLLSPDFNRSSIATEPNEDLLQDILLAEPELSRLGTIRRHN